LSDRKVGLIVLFIFIIDLFV